MTYGSDSEMPIGLRYSSRSILPGVIGLSIIASYDIPCTYVSCKTFRAGRIPAAASVSSLSARLSRIHDDQPRDQLEVAGRGGGLGGDGQGEVAAAAEPRTGGLGDVSDDGVQGYCAGYF